MRVPSLLCGLILTACGGSADPIDRPDTDTDTDVPGDTGVEPWEGDTFLTRVDPPGCADGMLVLGARTRGWTDGGGLVNLWMQGNPDGDRWSEEHDLPSVAHHEQGWWDELAVRVQPGVDYERNLASYFTCDGAEVAEPFVQAIRIYDVDGNLADCALLQRGVPEGIDEVLAGDTDEMVFTPPTRRDEITADHCEVWAPAG